MMSKKVKAVLRAIVPALLFVAASVCAGIAHAQKITHLSYKDFSSQPLVPAMLICYGLSLGSFALMIRKHAKSCPFRWFFLYMAIIMYATPALIALLWIGGL